MSLVSNFLQGCSVFFVCVLMHSWRDNNTVHVNREQGDFFLLLGEKFNRHLLLDVRFF